VKVTERLERMSLFDAMSDEGRTEWAARFRRERYAQDTVIIAQNEHPQAFYIVDKGQLAAYTGEAEALSTYYYSGDHFAATSLLTGEGHFATIKTLTDVELLVLDKDAFFELEDRYPEIEERFYVWDRQRQEAGRVRFPWQQSDEVTLLFATKHWVALLGHLSVAMLMGVVGLVLTVIYVEFPLGSLLALVVMFLAGAMLALAVVMAIYRFFDWRNDHYVVTTLRVLHVERDLLLRETRDEAPISQVQDVQVSQRGMLANLLGFGDVLIQTAAATERILFLDIAHPEYVRYAIFTPMRHAKEQQTEVLRETILEHLRERLEIGGDAPEGEELELQEPAPESAGELDEVNQSPLMFGWFQNAWGWLSRQFAFDTWIVSDGGKTVTWRKTGWILARNSLLPAMAAVLDMVGLSWLTLSGIGSVMLPLFLFLGLWLIFGWWFYIYWDWQNDLYRVSGNRLIDLKRRPLFLEESLRETTLDRVENIGLTIPGPVARMLNYGTIIIETAGEVGAFTFEHVHNPRAVQMEVFNRREQYMQQQREQQKRERFEELAQWFELYEELKRNPGTT
jgi:uncharacterized membrane protein YdbT with pleckstrin-like domain